MKIGIIGTAGRNEDGAKLLSTSFLKMANAVRSIISTKALKWYDVHLVSGGAAWADHVAVELYLKDGPRALTLAIPSKWDHRKCQYLDTGVVDWKTNPGGTSNHYHNLFSKRLGHDPHYTLLEIEDVICNGDNVTVVEMSGFHERNTLVADVDMMIALTFGKGNVVKDGGTADTMSKFLKKQNGNNENAFHVDLNDWSTHQFAQVERK